MSQWLIVSLRKQTTQRQRSGIAVLVLSCALLLAILWSGAAIRLAAKDRTYSDVQTIPHRKVGLLLGCAQYVHGNISNLFYQNRIMAAVALFEAKKIDYILVSGDNHTRGYDETSAMQNSLLEAGVPIDKIYLDYAGFRTLDSMVRAKEIFGQSEVTVISQEFHNQRAIFIAKHVDLDAIGFNAAEVDRFMGFHTWCREQLARVRTVLDVFVFGTQPKFLGQKIIIGTDPIQTHKP